jgi:hypothetical protein
MNNGKEERKKERKRKKRRRVKYNGGNCGVKRNET